MPDFFLPRALLSTGWASRVLVSSDEQGRITRLEADAELRPGVESLQGIAVPGIPNLHSHAFQRAMAGLTEARGPEGADSFWTWRERMYAFLARLSPDDVEAVAQQLFVEMLKAGYTSIVEFHYLHHDPNGRPYSDPAEMSRRLMSAARATGMAMTLCPSVYMTGDFGGAPATQGQMRFLLDPDGVGRLLDALAPDVAGVAGDPVRRLGVAPHSLRAVPPDALADVVAVAGRFSPSMPIHIHVAEQRREVEACLAWSGARPVEWLLDQAPVGPRWCLIHATHVTDEELVGIARSGAVVGLCPTTEGNLGDGRFPLRVHLEHGGAFGVGTDSHVSTSPVEELRWLEYGQRLTREARNVLTGFPHASSARTLLENVWVAGARAAGTEVGALRVGAHADWIVLDAEHPTLTGRSDDELLDSWVFSGNTSAVRHAVVGGRVVVRDGHHDREEETLERYRGTIRRILE
jgi:formimidoylglutamate deiminase